jgi:hypothetical protein
MQQDVLGCVTYALSLDKGEYKYIVENEYCPQKNYEISVMLVCYYKTL